MEFVRYAILKITSNIRFGPDPNTKIEIALLLTKNTLPIQLEELIVDSASLDSRKLYYFIKANNISLSSE